VKPQARPRRREPKQPELFLNRELSWLEFNGRVLEEATDAGNPLLERLKFATIVAGNLDEFFMVRVAALQNAVAEGDTAPDLAGLTPSQQLRAISERARGRWCTAAGRARAERRRGRRRSVPIRPRRPRAPRTRSAAP